MVLQEGGESLLMLKQLGTCIYTMWGDVTTSVERKASCNTSSYLMLPYLTLRF
jgi:hypothetical protein